MPKEGALLRKVLERTIHPVYLAEKFTTFFVVEHLECGHEQEAFPQSDPLIAKYRVCRRCSTLAAIPKKPAASEKRAYDGKRKSS